jgi:anti-sigma-K factor RskA
MEHTDVHELSAAYALDALDDAERVEFEQHLRGCERCLRDVAELSETAGLLAYGATAADPPAKLRSRILEEVRRERKVVVPLRRRRLVLGAVSGLAAASAAVAIGLGLWAASLSNDLDRTQAALDVLADPGARSVALQGAAGRLVVDGRGRAALVVRNLDPAPGGRTYELWVIQDDRPQRAGLFDGGDARDLVLLDRTVPEGAVVAVTVEQAGGVEAPTGTPLFTARA